MGAVRLRRQARRDIDGIADHTFAAWGAEQEDLYLAVLHEAFDRLAEFPDSGVAREDLAPGLRSLAVGRHVIFYLLNCDTIEIVRVLHQSIDVSRHLP